MPLQKIDAVGHSANGVFKVSASLVGLTAPQCGHGGKIEGIGGRAVMVLNFNLSQALIVDGVANHYAIA